VKSRLDVYDKQTKPLTDYFEKQGKVRNIPGVGQMDEIFVLITKVLG